MRLSSTFSFAFLVTSNAWPIAGPENQRAVKPAAFFLAGDSTTAVRGGWGDGFLTLLTNGAIGINFGHSGATTESFVHGGDWANVLDAVEANKAKYRPFITIQFGHNDQKAAANISIAQFKTNLAKMVEDVRGSGGSPILATSLTRRTFNSTTRRVIENLKEHAAAALEVAKANDVKFIDLNQVSTQYINSIGQVDADKYNLSPSDRTHLNVPGELLFGNMVADLISTSKIWKLGEQTRDYLAPSANIIAAIKNGVFILP